MSNIPEGHVAVEVVIKDDGTYETEVIGHGPNTSCMHEDDDGILEGLEDGIGEASDYGNTNEYYEETAPKVQPKPIDTKDNDGTPPPFGGKKNKGKQMDMGYGV